MIDAINFNSSSSALLIGNARRSISYKELGQLTEVNRRIFQNLPRPILAFMFCPNSASAVAVYLACLAERVALGLGEPDELLRNRVISAYRPSLLIIPIGEEGSKEYEYVGELAGGELALWLQRGKAYSIQPHPKLALLLATSGSTGDAKFVRLSLNNLESNCAVNRSVSRA